MTGMFACGAPVAPQRRNAKSREATPRSSNGFFTRGQVADRLPSAVRPTRMLARPARALQERQLWRSPTNSSTPAPRALASTAARPPASALHLALPEAAPAKARAISRLATAFSRVCCTLEHCLSHSHAR